jgi:transposase
MSAQKTYFGLTTAPQRKLLFETWEATKSVTLACERARVSRGLFYYWKKRFDGEGYPGLEEMKSHARKNVAKKEERISQQVIALHAAHPDWGKKRIEQELCKANNWVPLVSHNTIKRILREAGLWPTDVQGKKKDPRKSGAER